MLLMKVFSLSFPQMRFLEWNSVFIRRFPSLLKVLDSLLRRVAVSVSVVGFLIRNDPVSPECHQGSAQNITYTPTTQLTNVTTNRLTNDTLNYPAIKLTTNLTSNVSTYQLTKESPNLPTTIPTGYQPTYLLTRTKKNK